MRRTRGFVRAAGAAALLALPLAAQDRAAVDFEKSVLPILEKNCIECHRTAHVDAGGKQVRPKAGLALDTKAGILAGRRKQPVLVAGDPDASELYQIIALPEDDEDRMPPKDKKAALSARDKDVLRQWIASAKDTASMFGNWEGRAPATATAGAAATKAAGKPAATAGTMDPLTELAKGLSPLDPAVLQRLSARAHLESVGDGSPLLRVSFLGEESKTTDAVLASLAPAAGHVAFLDLGRTAITDAAATELAKMTHLVELDLRETKVTEATVRALQQLPNLRALNLHATRVGDGALEALIAMPALTTLHVWRSDLTAEAVTRLRAARPALRVTFAPDLPEPAADEAPARGRRRN